MPRIVSLRALLSFIGEPHIPRTPNSYSKENQFFQISSIDSHYTGDATKDVTKQGVGKTLHGPQI